MLQLSTKTGLTILQQNIWEDADTTTSLNDLLERKQFKQINLQVHQIKKKREITLKTGDYEDNLGDLVDNFFKTNITFIIKGSKNVELEDLVFRLSFIYKKREYKLNK